ncbi:sortase [Rathayibacter iranicus]|uniref:Sortase n=2 Tax=Rathayibacter iranicus TaxID=59737 RepID=A0AAD1AHJ7_9MICO|nr:sortase [Rathayibacter iranicus]AZZ56456.1 sortase [Rathayibacter iranicus]MWV31838.1 sortase [Rathayibacter iranicus NCPPB 2253 = VKM Ac-1602]PPI44707.1 sortase [Rathayibacter iranicus]PPI59138.1 sortase [Rathayibacter iranicus]PPI70226.1 sortase [Rathayibacter iranicus]
MPQARARGAALAAMLLALLALAVPAPAASAEPADALDVRELSAPGSLSDLAPGDQAEWAAEVSNSDSAAHDVSVGFTVDDRGALADDPRNGLQLTVDLCDSAFSVVEVPAGADRTVERYVCPGGTLPLGAGPAARLGRLEGVRPVEGGATAGVRVRVEFPATAGNDLELATASLRVVVRAADAADGGDPSDGPGDGSTDGSADGSGRAPVASGGLAVTGRDVGAALLGGLVALGVGAAVVVAGRRRREGRS